QFLARQAEGDVHERTALLLRGTAVEAGPVDLRVELPGLALVDGGNRAQPAQRLEPLEGEAEDVDAEGRRRVVERVVVRLHLVVQHRRQRRLRTREQILADDDQRDA